MVQFDERMLEALIWVRLFGLPVEFWNPKILEGIGNTIGAFVKVADTTRRGKFTSYARIRVYMNIAEPLPEHIELEYHDSVWQQPLDYEHIPFRCRFCHEYGHLARKCPLNKEEDYIRKPEEQHKATEGKEETEKDFQQVIRKKKPIREGARTKIQTQSPNIKSQNKLKILQQNNEEDEENMDEGEDLENEPMDIFQESGGKNAVQGETSKEEPEEGIETQNNQSQMETEQQQENEAEEEIVMKKLIQEWKNLDERFIPDQQKQMYKEAFQKFKERNKGNMENQDATTGEQGKEQLGIGGSGKSSRKRGRKRLNETFQTVGEILINSGKVIPLSEVFSFPSKTF